MEQKQQPPYPLRMTPEMRIQLEHEAAKQGRSLHAEIIGRLQMTLEGERPSAALVNTLCLAMARAEKNAALTVLRSKADLLDSARVSSALLTATKALEEAGITKLANDAAFASAHSIAFSFVADAKNFVDAGGVDLSLKAAVERESELCEMEQRLLEATSQIDSEVPPERSIPFKGSSGKKRQIKVTTKVARSSRPSSTTKTS